LIDLDGTEFKTILSGNTLCSISLACTRAAANRVYLPLYRYLNPAEIKTIPLPTVNCISGGSYQKGSVPFQERTVFPYKAVSIMKAVQIIYQIFRLTPVVIRDCQNGRPVVPGILHGRHAPSPDLTVSFDILYEAAWRCGASGKIAVGADCAASELYNPERKTYDFLGKEIALDALLG
jgi:enolase